MPGPSGRHKSHAFRSTTEFSALQSICGLHSSREVGRKGPKCFTQIRGTACPAPANAVSTVLSTPTIACVRAKMACDVPP